ncbi:hypothetical protein C9374_006273 [Naegleria lovaniensis]|uniref:Nitrate/nitrite sensing protein domain-containing protein n=1 Tax=Naegleria lovaniensis TaxID=51637 RepID=A0AA88GHU7_NAELO|nr:uncharacterized protein C9374_006273 [Naegleria lovaniensis]KAG2381284.1 hypothetical protein C9374_006273 [Naegleria lovaniensis]
MSQIHPELLNSNHPPSHSPLHNNNNNNPSSIATLHDGNSQTPLIPSSSKTQEQKFCSQFLLVRLIEKLPFSVKLLGPSLVLVFIVLVFSWIIVSLIAREVHSSATLTARSKWTFFISELVYCTLQERTLMTFLVASSVSGSTLPDDMFNQLFNVRNQTDEALRTLLSLTNNDVIPSSQYIETFPIALSRARQNWTSMSPSSVYESIAFFNEWNSMMISSVIALNAYIQDPSYSLLHGSLYHLLYMKELTGQQHAIGNIRVMRNLTERLQDEQVMIQNQAKFSLLQSQWMASNNLEIWNTFKQSVLVNSSLLLSEWNNNLTQQVLNIQNVETLTKQLTEAYISSVHQRNIGLLVLWMVMDLLIVVFCIWISLQFSHSIQLSWNNLQEIVRRQELYKSFIPSHVLLQLEGNNEEENVVEETEVRASKDDVKSKASNTESSTIDSIDMKHHNNKPNLAARFELYLDRKRISMLQLKFKGIEEILDFIGPNEIVEILKDVFERIQYASKASHGLLELWKDDSVTIVFNASKDQARHEQRALKTCMELKYRLTDMKKSKWLSNIKAQYLILASSHLEFQFAVHSQECLCGNIGSADLRSFKILGSIYENLSRLISFADRMEVKVVCEESISKLARTFFHTRYIGETELMEEGNIEQTSQVFELGAPLDVSEDEWLYELANKQKNDEWKDYNEACKEFFARNYTVALSKFLEHSIKHRNDLATENMIALCRKHSR